MIERYSSIKLSKALRAISSGPCKRNGKSRRGTVQGDPPAEEGSGEEVREAGNSMTFTDEELQKIPKRLGTEDANAQPLAARFTGALFSGAPMAATSAYPPIEDVD
jgi:hypothetical protein